jgi:DUF2075 family protein
MRKLPGFDPIIILKGIVMLFIALGLGLLYMFYRTGVTNIAAWIAVSLITLLLAYLYTVFFTDLDLFPGKGQNVSRMDHIVYHPDRFDIVIPILQQTVEVTWASIESILYDGQPYHDYESFGERYTFILIKEPVVKLDPNASRLNRLFSPGKAGLKLYIDDERNADFHTLKQAIDQYLKISTLYKDAKRGTLIKETVQTNGNKRVTTQQWKPEQTEYPLQLVYDVHHRDIADVLWQHGMLSE